MRLGIRDRVMVESMSLVDFRSTMQVLSQTQPVTGSADDPIRAERIALDNAADISTRLDGIPVGLLVHGGDRIAPTIDWRSLASVNRSGPSR